MAYDSEKKYIGGLWINKGQKDFVVGSGNITHPDNSVTKIQVLTNNNKREGKRDPDYNIVIDRYEKKSKDDHESAGQGHYAKPDESEVPF